jgi:hypothetical protein
VAFVRQRGQFRAFQRRAQFRRPCQQLKPLRSQRWKCRRTLAFFWLVNRRFATRKRGVRFRRTPPRGLRSRW